MVSIRRATKRCEVGEPTDHDVFLSKIIRIRTSVYILKHTWKDSRNDEERNVWCMLHIAE